MGGLPLTRQSSWRDLRGEPENTINMFANMKRWGLIITGALFKELYEAVRPKASKGAAA